MTHLCSTEELVVVGAGADVRVFLRKTGDCLLKYTHEFDKDAKDGINQAVNHRIEDLAVSGASKYVCALFSDKKVIVWDASQGWKVVGEIRTNRRSTALGFDHAGKCLYVADKSGDLYKYSVSDIGKDTMEQGTEDQEDSGPEPILGHVSMLLDVKTTENDKFILTADRDEKIRVSCAENPFMIESFCLGHTDFVSAVLPIHNRISDDQDLFISASGDGTVRLWKAGVGNELFCYNFEVGEKTTAVEEGGRKDDPQNKKSHSFVPSLLSNFSDKNLIAVASQQESKTNIRVFKFTGQTLAYDCESCVRNCCRLGGVAPWPSSSPSLCALAVTEGGKLSLMVYEYSDGEITALDDEANVKIISDQLQDISVDHFDVHKGLFKATNFEQLRTSDPQKEEIPKKTKLVTVDGPGRRAKRPRWVKKGTLS